MTFYSKNASWVKIIFCASTMSVSPNFTTGELTNVTEPRNVDGYRQQLDNTFPASSASFPTPIPVSRLRSIPRRRLVMICWIQEWMNFLLVMRLSVSVVLKTFTSIWWKNIILYRFITQTFIVLVLMLLCFGSSLAINKKSVYPQRVIIVYQDFVTFLLI